MGQRVSKPRRTARWRIALRWIVGVGSAVVFACIVVLWIRSASRVDWCAGILGETRETALDHWSASVSSSNLAGAMIEITRVRTFEATSSNGDLGLRLCTKRYRAFDATKQVPPRVGSISHFQRDTDARAWLAIELGGRPAIGFTDFVESPIGTIWLLSDKERCSPHVSPIQRRDDLYAQLYANQGWMCCTIQLLGMEITTSTDDLFPTEIVAPHWLIAATFAIPPIWFGRHLVLLAIRRRRPNRCMNCGYDLSGSPVGVPCSECGTARADTPTPPPASPSPPMPVSGSEA